MKDKVRYEKFLGINANGMIVHANFGIHKDGCFFASYEGNMPIRSEDYDLEELYKERYCEENLGEDGMYRLCKELDCAPSEVPGKIMEENAQSWYGDVRDVLDCSLFPEEVEIHDDTWFFESCHFGQWDYLEEGGLVEQADARAVMDLYQLWQNWHFKEISEDGAEFVDAIANMLPDKGSDEEIEQIEAVIEAIAYDEHGEYIGYDFIRNQREEKPIQPSSLKDVDKQAREECEALESEIDNLLERAVELNTSETQPSLKEVGKQAREASDALKNNAEKGERIFFKGGDAR